MASLVKQGGTYGLIWTDNSRAQSQTRETLKTSNKREAKKLKARLEHEYWQGQHDPWHRKWYRRHTTDDDITLFDASEEFITFKTNARGRQGWGKQTAKKETMFMRMFRDFIGSGRPVSSINEKDLEDFYYREQVHSDHTRNSYYISVNTFLNWCLRKEYITKKPTYKPSKPQRKVPKFIYPDDLARLIEWRLGRFHRNINDDEFAKPERHAYWLVYGWMVLAGTGMRPSELARVKLPHIEKNSILIGEDFTTKVRAERRVPLLFESQQAVDILTSAGFRSREPYMRESDALLGRAEWTARNRLSREFTKAWAACFPHKARRTLYNLKDMFAVRYLTDESITERAGLKINSLKEILGHSSLETTQKYLKAVPHGTSIDGTIWDYVPEKVWPRP